MFSTLIFEKINVLEVEIKAQIVKLELINFDITAQWCLIHQYSDLYTIMQIIKLTIATCGVVCPKLKTLK